VLRCAARIARRIDRRIASTDDEHPGTNANWFAQIDLSKKGDTVIDALAVFAGDAEVLWFVCADSQEHGAETFVKQLVDVADRVKHAQVNAKGKDVVDLALQHLMREAIGWDADAHHTARDSKGLKDSDAIVQARQKVRRCQPRRAASHNRDARAVTDSRAGRRARGCLLCVHPVSDKALERANGYRAVDLTAAALGLTRMVTHAAYRGGEGIVLHDDIHRLFVAALSDECDVTLSARLCRAGCLAGRNTTLGDRKAAGDCLWKGTIDGGSIGEAQLKLAGHTNRADSGALVTRIAPVPIHISRLATDANPKVANEPFYFFDLRVGVERDVGTLRGLDHLGGQDAL